MKVDEKVKKILHELGSKMPHPKGLKITIPPPCLEVFKLEYVDFEYGKSLKAKIDFDQSLTNPMGIIQGGALMAYADNVLGPLSFTAAENPTSTIEFSCNYFRPFTPKDEHIFLEAKVISKTKSLLYMEADATNKEGKPLCRFKTTMMIQHGH